MLSPSGVTSTQPAQPSLLFRYTMEVTAQYADKLGFCSFLTLGLRSPVFKQTLE